MKVRADGSQASATTTGLRIRNARISKGWTLDQLAKTLGISKVSISCWENGKSRPRASRINEVAEALGLSVEALIDEIVPSPGHAGHPTTLILECRMRIAEALGVHPTDVDIKVSFGFGPEIASDTGALTAEEFLAMGGALRQRLEQIRLRLIDLRTYARGQSEDEMLRLRYEQEVLTQELAECTARYLGQKR